jgi:hypothetical protein
MFIVPDVIGLLDYALTWIEHMVRRPIHLPLGTSVVDLEKRIMVSIGNTTSHEETLDTVGSTNIVIIIKLVPGYVTPLRAQEASGILETGK